MNGVMLRGQCWQRVRIRYDIMTDISNSFPTDLFQSSPMALIGHLSHAYDTCYTCDVSIGAEAGTVAGTTGGTGEVAGTF